MIEQGKVKHRRDYQLEITYNIVSSVGIHSLFVYSSPGSATAPVSTAVKMTRVVKARTLAPRDGYIILAWDYNQYSLRRLRASTAPVIE
jgi:hypothetical protein